jgi:hypothetical protein
VQTFLFGFDAACIAFCGATLEQILKEALIRSKEYAERQLRQERLTGLGLLMKANEKKLIIESYEEPERSSLSETSECIKVYVEKMSF